MCISNVIACTQSCLDGQNLHKYVCDMHLMVEMYSKSIQSVDCIDKLWCIDTEQVGL